ncbi:MAG: DUF4149 domain-containing protein [Proteobacteria bacterium]|jgi:hypothetical protein|nr:DUF4149 domain-containing protein [Pseudomonadota bacterium]|tara:strand:+ start:25635 stop:26081 length:447 start_codon:yes stop_codon:yes gene_type:complete
MENFLNKLSVVLTALWVGGLWTMLMVTSVLFMKIPSNYIAGAIAGDMFAFVNYFGIFVSLYLIFFGCRRSGIRLLKESYFWIVLVMLVVVIVNYFGISSVLEALKIEALPKEVMESVFSDRYRTWHGIASMAYLLECVLGIFLVLKIR